MLPLNRRQILKQASAAGAAFLAPGNAAETLRIADREVEIQLSPVSAHTFRLTVLPIQNGALSRLPDDGTLVETSFGPPAARLRGAPRAQTIKCGDLKIHFSPSPPAFSVEGAKGETIQKISIDASTGAVSFTTGDAPLLGLGEGGPQFDRRGSADRMRSGQGGYQLRTHGGRVPVPWIVGTAGWAMFIHQPYGSFDFTGAESKFLPASRRPPCRSISSSWPPKTPPPSWPSMRGSPAIPSCRRCGASATSNPTARSPAARRSCRKPKRSAKRSCPATP